MGRKRMKHAVRFVAVFLACTAGGCVERRFVVTTDPPGAVVLHNNVDLGLAPADDFFVYYGIHHFTLIRDGFETQQVDQDIPAPWYELPVIDFFAENVIPWKIRDVRRFHYQMQPQKTPNVRDVLERSEQLRNKGKSIGPPPAPPPPALPTP
jgi:hypothetical protein